MHGNGRYGHFLDLVFRSKIEKCKQFSEMVRFWTVASKIPPTLANAQNVGADMGLGVRNQGLEASV